MTKDQTQAVILELYRREAAIKAAIEAAFIELRYFVNERRDAAPAEPARDPIAEFLASPLAQRVERGGDHKPGEPVPDFVAVAADPSELAAASANNPIHAIPIATPEPGTGDDT